MATTLYFDTTNDEVRRVIDNRNAIAGLDVKQDTDRTLNVYIVSGITSNSAFHEDGILTLGIRRAMGLPLTTLLDDAPDWTESTDAQGIRYWSGVTDYNVADLTSYIDPGRLDTEILAEFLYADENGLEHRHRFKLRVANNLIAADGVQIPSVPIAITKTATAAFNTNTNIAVVNEPGDGVFDVGSQDEAFAFAGSTQYVASSTFSGLGDDSANGQSPHTPVLTITQALTNLEVLAGGVGVGNGQGRIYLSAGTYDEPTLIVGSWTQIYGVGTSGTRGCTCLKNTGTGPIMRFQQTAGAEIGQPVPGGSNHSSILNNLFFEQREVVSGAYHATNDVCVDYSAGGFNCSMRAVRFKFGYCGIRCVEALTSTLLIDCSGGFHGSYGDENFDGRGGFLVIDDEVANSSYTIKIIGGEFDNLPQLLDIQGGNSGQITIDGAKFERNDQIRGNSDLTRIARYEFVAVGADPPRHHFAMRDSIHIGGFSDPSGRNDIRCIVQQVGADAKNATNVSVDIDGMNLVQQDLAGTVPNYFQNDYLGTAFPMTRGVSGSNYNKHVVARWTNREIAANAVTARDDVAATVAGAPLHHWYQDVSGRIHRNAGLAVRAVRDLSGQSDVYLVPTAEEIATGIIEINNASGTCTIAGIDRATLPDNGAGGGSGAGVGFIFEIISKNLTYATTLKFNDNANAPNYAFYMDDNADRVVGSPGAARVGVFSNKWILLT